MPDLNKTRLVVEEAIFWAENMTKAETIEFFSAIINELNAYKECKEEELETETE